ncbi:hypothetical protein DEO72_LG3g1649 [Vigna unguiculata]|uniref:Uncharacterized protein n=1 Tax=Vigna unguiculata TaxID=3917 RepID=A0A4D6LEX4_VIGUN|nr:hypothetical protein DEO72_LG3g1649 [Vigna unguiculata]
MLSFCAAVPVSESAPGSTKFFGLGSEFDISPFSGKGSYGLLMETVARSDNLAQASLSRLGEMSIDSPRPFHARGRSGNHLRFERARMRIGHCFCVSSSRLGEGNSLSERPSRLSETLQPGQSVG